MAMAATHSGPFSHKGSLRPRHRSFARLEGRQQQPHQNKRKGDARHQRLGDAHRQREVENLRELRQEQVERVDQSQDHEQTADAPGTSVRQLHQPPFRTAWREDRHDQSGDAHEYEGRIEKRDTRGRCGRVVEKSQIFEARVAQKRCGHAWNGARGSNPCRRRRALKEGWWSSIGRRSIARDIQNDRFQQQIDTDYRRKQNESASLLLIDRAPPVPRIVVDAPLDRLASVLEIVPELGKQRTRSLFRKAANEQTKAKVRYLVDRLTRAPPGNFQRLDGAGHLRLLRTKTGSLGRDRRSFRWRILARRWPEPSDLRLKIREARP